MCQTLKANHNTNFKKAGLSYYGHCREDILAHVPIRSKRVLSVGCGSGLTESKLVKNGVEVFGIELNKSAAKAAEKRGLKIINCDVLKADLGIIGGSFDCIIYADVLEHLVDPMAVLMYHIKFLKSDGIIIVSVPNFRHFSVLYQLFFKGHIEYCDAGILDRTHLRITTRKMVEKWFIDNQIKLVSYDGILGPKRKLVSFLTFGLLKDFLFKQVVLVGQKNGK